MSESYNDISGVRRRPRSYYRHKSRPEEGRTRSSGRPRKGRAEEREESRRPAPEREAPRSWESSDPRKALPYYAAEEEMEPGFRLPFDPWRLAGAARRNWAWILAGACLLGLAGLLLGAMMVEYKVNVPLLRNRTPNAFGAEAAGQFGPREYSDQTIFAFMRSGEVMRRVANRAATNPMLAPLGVTPQLLAGSVSIVPMPNPDQVVLQMAAFDPDLPRMVELANVYAEVATDYTREVQRTDAMAMTEYLREKLRQAETAVRAATLHLRTNFSSTGFGDFDRETENKLTRLQELRETLQSKQIEREGLERQIAARKERLREVGPMNAELEKARAELRAMITVQGRTEQHPAVQSQRRQIEQLERLLASGGAAGDAVAEGPASDGRIMEMEGNLPKLDGEIQTLTNAITRLETELSQNAETGVRYAMMEGELRSLQTTQALLAAKAQQAELIAKSAMGYFDLMSPATLESVDYNKRWLKVGLLGFGAGLLGLVASLGLVMLNEAMDTSLKTREDVTRVTQLPVLATLGDLRKMTPDQQVKWSFRTLTLLRGKLSRDSDQALVCGIISSGPGEGRSTWVNLLVSAASQRGLRVLTVDTRTAGEGPAVGAREGEVPREKTAKNRAAAAGEERNGHASAEAAELPAEEQEETGEEHNVLSKPDHVARQLQKAKAQPVVHIPLPGWVWSLERRKQWQKALDYWKKIDNMVIFVELPPASEEEAVLLAEHVPQLIWLVGSGMADAKETSIQLDTLRHARCNLVGAVLNQAPPPLINNRIARWFSRTAAMMVLGAGLMAPAGAQERSAEAEAAAAQENLTFTANARGERAEWQERLTFGPGDRMDISLYGQPSLTRTNIFVGPDGRISYLQAQGVMAAGLTVEELRERLNEVLSQYYTSPAIVTPVSFASKKYYVLGRVAARGVYPLDRPLTVIEALARAKGLQTGMYQRNSVELADLSRSFLIRDGEKVPVDFERLFLHGDLSQNIMIEPNDYLYFASAGTRDIYVLGEVMSPGPIGFMSEPTVIRAITDRAGFTERAYKRKVLVVRGSLKAPETFVVDAGGILDGRVEDFKLQPRDIVYVRDRPWIKVEELLDEAIQSFIQGAVTTWAGVNIGPIIKQELLPQTR